MPSRWPLASTKTARTRNLSRWFQGCSAAILLSLLDAVAPSAGAASAEFVRAQTLPFSLGYGLYTRGLVTDYAGNSIVAVAFNLASTYTNTLAKLDPEGNILWNKRGVLPHIWDLAVDQTGAVYVAGSLLNGPRARLTPLPSDYFARLGIAAVGAGTAYVAKISPSGEFEWVRQFGGESNKAQALSVAVDGESNYYVAGEYLQGAVIEGVTLPSARYNAFVAKFAPDGELRWVRPANGTEKWWPTGVRVRVGERGQVLFSTMEAPFFPESGLEGDGPFLSQFDSGGRHLWTIPTIGSSGGLYGSALDREGNVYHGVAWGGKLRLDKYDTDGKLLWSREPLVEHWDESAYPPTVYSSDLSVDAEGNCIWAGGIWWASVTFGGFSTAPNPFYLFVAKYSPSGDVRWLVQSESASEAAIVVSVEPSLYLSVGPSGVIDVFGSLNTNAGHENGDRRVWFGDTMLETPVGPTPTGSSWTPTIWVGFLARILDSEVVPAPALRVERRTGGVLLTWPSEASAFVIETTTGLVSGNWQPVSESPVVEAGRNVLTIKPPPHSAFFRLTRK